MRTVWAQRREELVSDCLVSPDVFHSDGRPSGRVRRAISTRPRGRGRPAQHASLSQGLLSHLPRKNAEDIATFVDVERQVIQDFIGTVPWDHRPLITVLVGQVAERLGNPMASSPSIRTVFPSAARTRWG